MIVTCTLLINARLVTHCSRMSVKVPENIANICDKNSILYRIIQTNTTTVTMNSNKYNK